MEKSGGLIGLKHGEHSVTDYSIDFRTRANQSGWNSSSLCDALHHGLEDYIKDEMYPMKGPPLWMELLS